METAVKERLIGAAVLVVVVVLVVPALLRGPRPPAEPPVPAGDETRVVEIDLGGGSRTVEPAAAPAPEQALAPQQEPAGMAPPAAAATAVPPPAESPAGEKPAADSPAERPPAPAAPAAVPRAAGWAVQVAALSKRDAAEQMVADLGRKGFAAFVQEHRSGGRVLYRVRVGPEAGRDGAEALARRLREGGFKATIVAHP